MKNVHLFGFLFAPVVKMSLYSNQFLPNFIPMSYLIRLQFTGKPSLRNGKGANGWLFPIGIT